MVYQKWKRIGNPNTVSENIQSGMEFGIDKCAMLIMRNRKQHMMEQIQLPNQEKIRMPGEKDPYKYFGILEADTITQVVMKGKIKKEYLRRMRKLLETRLYRRNLIKRINNWAVPHCKILKTILKVDEGRMNQRMRKFMKMHKAWQPRSDTDRLYVSIREGGRWLVSIEDSINVLIQWLEDYIKKCQGRLLTVSRNNTDNTSINRTKITRNKNGKKNNFLSGK